VTLAKGTQKSQGLTDLCYVTLPHPLGMIPLEEVAAKVDAAFDDFVTASTAWKATKEPDSAAVKPYPAKRMRFKGDYAALNELFRSRRWSLGLPIVPPTPDKVAAMLKGTRRDPAEVLWVVPPREGILTVELVAALGVMAGAGPEHMPLLLATVEAFKDPNVSWRGTTTTTAPTVPVIILNGPIIEKLGLNSGTGTAGAENPVTNALGYFINLVGDVVGGSVPPNMDKSTHGTSADIVAMVFTENEKENPWKESYAVEQGFKPTDSVVTVFGSYLGGCNVDHDSMTGESLLNTIAMTVMGNAAGVVSCLADYDKPLGKPNTSPYSFLFLCPEHAAQIQRDFPTKEAAREYLLKVTGAPFKYYAPSRCMPPAEFGSVTPETFIPRFATTKSFKIVVTGGPGKQSQTWSPFPQVVKPVSVKIDM
jgi:hypothetical protein